MPIGLGKAISSSFPSPSPFTLTTVPIPHFLWAALSPTPSRFLHRLLRMVQKLLFQSAGTCSCGSLLTGDPVLEELYGVCLALGVFGFGFRSSRSSSGISLIKRETGFMLVRPYNVRIWALVMNSSFSARVIPT